MAQPNREASRERREHPRDPELSEFSNDYLEQLPANKAEFLERHVEWIAQNHEGIAPEAKVQNWGGTVESETRKEVCEDAALKMPEKGLYVVADGVSSEGGWFASRVATEHLGQTLGVDLDQAIENHASTISPDGRTEGKQTLEQVTEEIRRRIDTAIRDCDKLIKKCASENPSEYGLRSGSTLALGKLVELPDGEGGHVQRLFYATLGDSPVYVRRKNGRIEKIVREDSLINMRLEAGQITEADVEKIQLARDEYALPRHLRDTFLKAQVITQSLGISGLYTQDGEMRGGMKEDLVQYIDLQPGDRVILASDGFSDQFIEADIDGMMAMTEGDDAAADDLMQERALDSSRKGRRNNPRAKRDDIAAMSFTAGERGPSREYLRTEQEQGKKNETQVTVNLGRSSEGAINQHHEIRNQLELDWAQMKQQLEEDAETARESGDHMALRDRLLREMQILKKEQEVDGARYSIERLQLNNTDMDMQPRFALGQDVRVMVVDADSGAQHPHPQAWKVVKYNPKRSEYMLEGPGGERIRQSRYQLELDQPNIQPRRGDVMSVPMDFGGGFELGFQVADVDYKTGDLLMVKEDVNGRTERRISAADAQHMYRQRLHLAQGGKERMDQYHQAYESTQTEIEKTKDRRDQIMQMEARNKVMTRFQQEVRGHSADLAKIDRQIENAEKILARFEDLERKQRLPAGITREERTELRKLKIKVYPTTQRPRLDEGYIQQLRAERDKLRRKVITREES